MNAVEKVNTTEKSAKGSSKKKSKNKKNQNQHQSAVLVAENHHSATNSKSITCKKQIGDGAIMNGNSDDTEVNLISENFEDNFHIKENGCTDGVSSGKTKKLSTSNNLKMSNGRANSPQPQLHQPQPQLHQQKHQNETKKNSTIANKSSSSSSSSSQPSSLSLSSQSLSMKRTGTKLHEPQQQRQKQQPKQQNEKNLANKLENHESASSNIRLTSKKHNKKSKNKSTSSSAPTTISLDNNDISSTISEQQQENSASSVEVVSAAVTTVTTMKPPSSSSLLDVTESKNGSNSYETDLGEVNSTENNQENTSLSSILCSTTTNACSYTATDKDKSCHQNQKSVVKNINDKDSSSNEQKDNDENKVNNSELTNNNNSSSNLSDNDNRLSSVSSSCKDKEENKGKEEINLPKEIGPTTSAAAIAADTAAQAQSSSLTDTLSPSSLVRSDIVIEYKEYESELQMQDIMRLIQSELSEPYSIYTYRYFIYNWPKLCFLAAHGSEYVGAIVCKLDMHMNFKRGYIAMLAVKKEYRKLRIGTTLVEKAIEAMLADNADEVVLETEMKNIPALRLYENLGFVRDKRLFRYYLNGVDALRLKLWFR